MAFMRVSIVGDPQKRVTCARGFRKCNSGACIEAPWGSQMRC